MERTLWNMAVEDTLTWAMVWDNKRITVLGLFMRCSFVDHTNLGPHQVICRHSSMAGHVSYELGFFQSSDWFTCPGRMVSNRENFRNHIYIQIRLHRFQITKKRIRSFLLFHYCWSRSVTRKCSPWGSNFTSVRFECAGMIMYKIELSK